jgi:hypothetical protein
VPVGSTGRSPIPGPSEGRCARGFPSIILAILLRWDRPGAAPRRAAGDAATTY